jgi:putative transposase
MKYQELSDEQWNMISKHLPKPAKTGRPRHDDRTTINGIIYVLICGCRWSEMPKRFGSKSTAHRRLQTWQQNNIWKNILSDAIKSAHSSGKLQLQKISIDSSTIPAKKGEM